MQSIQELQDKKNEVDKQIQTLLRSSVIRELQKLRKRKTNLTRHIAMIRFRKKNTK